MKAGTRISKRRRARFSTCTCMDAACSKNRGLARAITSSGSRATGATKTATHSHILISTPMHLRELGCCMSPVNLTGHVSGVRVIVYFHLVLQLAEVSGDVAFEAFRA